MIPKRIVSQNNKFYDLKFEDGIYVEIPFDSISDNRYTVDNNTYKSGYKCTYKYKYIDRKGVAFLFETRNREWNFIQYDSASHIAINKIELSVKPNFGPFAKYQDSYEQSVIEYSYLNANNEKLFSEHTGLIENTKNIWMHPPRSRLFELLELNPFPFIQAPYEIGNTWKWQLTIGENWGDERWITWEGKITNHYEYEIVDVSFLNTQFGDIECFKIKSIIKNSLGTSELISYFNKNYGFIRFEYCNIDNSKFIFEMIDKK